jgi:hypothetical protein
VTTGSCGNGVAARRLRGGRLRFFDYASARSTIIADLGYRLGIGLAASPDGRTVLFTRADSPSSDLMMIENF